MSSTEDYRRQAETALRLARWCTDADAKARLLIAASDYAAKATEVDGAAKPILLRIPKSDEGPPPD